LIQHWFCLLATIAGRQFEDNFENKVTKVTLIHFLPASSRTMMVISSKSLSLSN